MCHMMAIGASFTHKKVRKLFTQEQVVTSVFVRLPTDGSAEGMS